MHKLSFNKGYSVENKSEYENVAPMNTMTTSEKHLFSYHGEGISLGLLMLKNFFLTVITLGIYVPWARTDLRRYFWSNTSFKQDRFTYTGEGIELFKGWVKLACIILAFGIVGNVLSKLLPTPLNLFVGLLILPGYLYVFAIGTYAGLRYRAQRTLWRQIRFNVIRNHKLTREFVLLFMKGSVFSGLTFGIYVPFFTINKQQFLISKSNYGGIDFSFTGEGEEYFWICIKGFFLSIITLGIYIPWFMVERAQYKLNHTRIGQAQFKMDLTGGRLLKYAFVGYLATVFTAGLASPWVITAFFKLFAECTTLQGDVDFSTAQNIKATDESALGDDMISSYDIDLGFF